MMDYYIVIPVQRGFNTIETLCERITAYFQHKDDTFEIILIDDGSSDGSWKIIKQISEGSSIIKAVRFKRSFGQHNATLCGIAIASGQNVITMDEDLQQAPEDIEILLSARNEHDADVVYGVAQQDRHAWWRRSISSFAMPLIYKLASFNFLASSFRLMSRETGMNITKIKRPDIIIDFHIVCSNAKIISVLTPGRQNIRGKSTYRLHALSRHPASQCSSYIHNARGFRETGFSTRPQYEIEETIPEDIMK